MKLLSECFIDHTVAREYVFLVAVFILVNALGFITVRVHLAYHVAFWNRKRALDYLMVKAEC